MAKDDKKRGGEGRQEASGIADLEKQKEIIDRKRRIMNECERILKEEVADRARAEQLLGDLRDLKLELKNLESVANNDPKLIGDIELLLKSIKEWIDMVDDVAQQVESLAASKRATPDTADQADLRATTAAGKKETGKEGSLESLLELSETKFMKQFTKYVQLRTTVRDNAEIKYWEIIHPDVEKGKTLVAFSDEPKKDILLRKLYYVLKGDTENPIRFGTIDTFVSLPVAARKEPEPALTTTATKKESKKEPLSLEVLLKLSPEDFVTEVIGTVKQGTTPNGPVWETTYPTLSGLGYVSLISKEPQPESFVRGILKDLQDQEKEKRQAASSLSQKKRVSHAEAKAVYDQSYDREKAKKFTNADANTLARAGAASMKVKLESSARDKKETKKDSAAEIEAMIKNDFIPGLGKAVSEEIRKVLFEVPNLSDEERLNILDNLYSRAENYLNDQYPELGGMQDPRDTRVRDNRALRLGIGKNNVPNAENIRTAIEKAARFLKENNTKENVFPLQMSSARARVSSSDISSSVDHTGTHNDTAAATAPDFSTASTRDQSLDSAMSNGAEWNVERVFDELTLALGKNIVDPIRSTIEDLNLAPKEALSTLNYLRRRMREYLEKQDKQTEIPAVILGLQSKDGTVDDGIIKELVIDADRKKEKLFPLRSKKKKTPAVPSPAPATAPTEPKPSVSTEPVAALPVEPTAPVKTDVHPPADTGTPTKGPDTTPTVEPVVTKEAEKHAPAEAKDHVHATDDHGENKEEHGHEEEHPKEHGHIVDIEDRVLLEIIGPEPLQRTMQLLATGGEKKGQAKVEWQGIFARIDSKARETLANEVMRAGYENLGDFLKDWEDHLYEPTFEALSRWADQERRNAAAESITFLDKRKIDTLERVKQMAPLAGIAAVGVVGNLFGTVTGVVRPVITTLVGSALGGITGFFREKMKKQYAESKEKIAKENAALVAERERDVAIVETVINRFKELDGRDIAGFVSQAIRSASGVEATTNDREANAELLYLAIKKHQQEEAAKLLETDKENGELIAKDQERRAENLIAQLYSSDHLGHKIHELLELHAKDPFVIELAKKVMALRAGNVAELFKKEEHGDHGEEKKEEGHGSAHAHGHGHGHGGEKSHGKKESGKKGGKGKKGEMTEEEKQDIKNALLGAVFGGGFGLALSAIPEFRAAMGALSGGYLGYRYAQITNVEAREKAFIKDITKYIETAEKKVQKRESVEWGKDSMEELMSLATELRIPLSLGVLGKDTYFGLYMRAKNVLRRIEGLMIAEHLKDASMEQLLGSLDKQNHELHEKREKALEKLKKGSITRQVVYGTIGAAVGGVLAYGIADGGRHLNEWFGPEAHDAVPPGGDRMPSAPQERVDVAPPLYQVELPPQETWKPDIFYVGRGEGVSYPIYDDLTAHPDHVKLYVEGNSGSPEANKIQAILERRGGDVNQLNEADLRRIAGLISKHDFGAIDANGDTILGVSTKGIDKVGVYFDPETCKFVMNANPDELYATRIPHGSTSVPEAPAAVQPPESAVPELGERMNTPVKTWTWGGTGMASGQPLQEFTNGAEKLFINETTNLIYNAEGNRIGWFDGNIHRGGSPAGYSGPEKIGPIQTLPEGSFPAPTLKESDATYDVLRQYGMGKGFNEGIAHTLTETAPVQRSAARVVVPETTSRPVGEVPAPREGVRAIEEVPTVPTEKHITVPGGNVTVKMESGRSIVEAFHVDTPMNDDQIRGALFGKSMPDDVRKEFNNPASGLREDLKMMADVDALYQECRRAGQTDAAKALYDKGQQIILYLKEEYSVLNKAEEVYDKAFLERYGFTPIEFNAPVNMSYDAMEKAIEMSKIYTPEQKIALENLAFYQNASESIYGDADRLKHFLVTNNLLTPNQLNDEEVKAVIDSMVKNHARATEILQESIVTGKGYMDIVNGLNNTMVGFKTAMFQSDGTPWNIKITELDSPQLRMERAEYSRLYGLLKQGDIGSRLAQEYGLQAMNRIEKASE